MVRYKSNLQVQFLDLFFCFIWLYVDFTGVVSTPILRRNWQQQYVHLVTGKLKRRSGTLMDFQERLDPILN